MPPARAPGRRWTGSLGDGVLAPMTTRSVTAARLLSAFVAIAVAPREARAADEPGGWIIPGFLFGPTFGTPHAFAIGGELSFMAYRSKNDAWGMGAFTQLQHYGGSDAGLSRWAAGLQGGGIVGAELGVDHRAASGLYAGTTGAHIAPYVSIGILTAAVRLTAPLASSGAGTAYGTEIALAFGVKVPIPWGQLAPRAVADAFGSGRPIVVDGAHRLAPLVRHVRRLRRNDQKSSSR